MLFDLGEGSLCRLRGDGVRLRLLLTSPFLAPDPPVALLGASSSEDEDPVSETTQTNDIKSCFSEALAVCGQGKNTKVGVRTQLQKSMRR